MIFRTNRAWIEVDFAVVESAVRVLGKMDFEDKNTIRTTLLSEDIVQNNGKSKKNAIISNDNALIGSMEDYIIHISQIARENLRKEA